MEFICSQLGYRLGRVGRQEHLAQAGIIISPDRFTERLQQVQQPVWLKPVLNFIDEDDRSLRNPRSLEREGDQPLGAQACVRERYCPLMQAQPRSAAHRASV